MPMRAQARRGRTRSKLEKAEANIASIKAKAMSEVGTIAEDTAARNRPRTDRRQRRQGHGRCRGQSRRRAKEAIMDATFWATVGLIIFLAIVVYLKVPATIGKSLDARADKIRAELEEARRLREEAQQLLAEYQRKRKDAEKEAAEIVDHAKREAGVLVTEAKQKTEEYVAAP